MKRFIAIILALCLTMIYVRSQPTKSTTVEFDQTKWDFGKIDELKGPVSYTFRFQNTGTIPFVINAINTSCGCTTPQYSRAPVLPGKSGQITVVYDPTNRPGRFEKTINIISNADTKSAPLLLYISGEVKGRPRTIEDDYPYSINHGIRIETRSLKLGNITRGERSIATIGLANNSKNQVTVSLNTTQMPEYVSLRIPKATLNPGERSEIELTIDGTKTNIWGHERLSFSLITNALSSDDAIVAEYTFIEDFKNLTNSERKDAPRAEYSSYFCHLSDQPQGKTLETEFTLRNGGKADLIIRHIGPSSSRIEATSDLMTLRPGHTARLTISLPKPRRGVLMESVQIITNDPERPAQEIRIMANIK